MQVLDNNTNNTRFEDAPLVLDTRPIFDLIIFFKRSVIYLFSYLLCHYAFFAPNFQ